MRIAIACGGTGGHIFPGLTTARYLAERGHQVALWTAGTAIEKRALADWRGDTICIETSGLSSGSLTARLLGAPRMLAAVVKSVCQMRRDGPDVLLAMGGYGSLAPALAARFLHKRIILHEANAIPGKTNRFLAHFAESVAVTFKDTAAFFGARSRFTGLPVSISASRFYRRTPTSDAFTLLIMGGSQGARALNEICSAAVCRLAQNGFPIQVIHLTGTADESMVRRRYANAGVQCHVYAFLTDMHTAYGNADFAVSRAGAASVMELAAYGLPALLVPYPYAADDHQTANARALAEQGAADLQLQSELSTEWLIRYIKLIYRDMRKLETMRKKMTACSQPDATRQLAELVLGESP